MNDQAGRPRNDVSRSTVILLRSRPDRIGRRALAVLAAVALIAGFPAVATQTATAAVTGVSDVAQAAPIDAATSKRPAKHAPIAIVDTYHTGANDALVASAREGVLANDIVAENDSPSAILVRGTSKGNLDLSSNGSFSYLPAADFEGTASFAYLVRDGGVDSNAMTVTITVGGLQVAPDYGIADGSPLPVDADPAAGYGAQWLVTNPDGQPRLDGTIAVGDDLRLAFAAADGTAITGCQLRLLSAGGWLMHSPGNLVDGGCTLTSRLPDFPEPKDRAAQGPDGSGLDLCVVAFIQFADNQTRQLAAADQAQPGGRLCYNGSTPGDQNVLDFRVAPGGTARAFVSDPPMMSWNPADWGTDMTPLAFGRTWHYEAPAWVSSCQPYLNGSWQTVISPMHPSGCAAWDVRLPGVLPATLPWSGNAGDWDMELVSAYTATAGQPGSVTITDMRIPIAPSDTVFESSLPAIFPVDLATTRFVTVGEPWRPVFQMTGDAVSECALEMVTVPPTWPVGDITWTTYHAPAGPDGRCTFEIPALGSNEFHQYFATAYVGDGEVQFGGSISSIPAPAPPTIDVPTEAGGGQTDIGVEPGTGQGLGLGVEVTPELASTPSPDTASATTTGFRAIAAAVNVACQDSTFSTDMTNGGAIPRLDAQCGLAPGTYLATARMIDAAGVATSSTRTFTVLSPRPWVTGHLPASAASGVARNVRPTVFFDMPVSGIAGSTVRLWDLGTHKYVAATVAYDGTTYGATLRPAASLGVGHSYRLYLTSGITSAAGRPLLATSWTFKVSSDTKRPTFTSTPRPAARGVSRTANLSLTFSESVTGVSAKTIRLKDSTTGRYVAAIVTYDTAHRRAIVNPSSTLRGMHRYVVTIVSGIRDRAGNSLLSSSWSLTTRR